MFTIGPEKLYFEPASTKTLRPLVEDDGTPLQLYWTQMPLYPSEVDDE